MKKLIIIFAVTVLLSGFASAGTWTTLDYPGANQTQVRGIDGGNLVGAYQDNSGIWHGFVRSGTSWTTLDAPEATDTYVHGIDGSNIVGYYTDASYHDHGFLYDGTTWTTLDAPGASSTFVGGIDGGNIVGSYNDHGFIYDGTTWTTLDMPGRDTTIVYGIDGSNVVGRSSTNPTDMGQLRSGFLYDGTTWTVLQAPGEQGSADTWVTDIDGDNIVGYYRRFGDHGFLYNGTTWKFFDATGSGSTKIWGIDGYLLVGSYWDSSYKDHGFVYEIPEPASAILLIAGATVLGLCRKKR